MGVGRPSRHAIRIKINIYVSILNRGNRFYTVGIQQLDKDIYVIYIFCIYIHFYFYQQVSGQRNPRHHILYKH